MNGLDAATMVICCGYGWVCGGGAAVLFIAFVELNGESNKKLAAGSTVIAIGVNP